MHYDSPIKRRKTRRIMVGNVPVGGDAPISVQTMTNTKPAMSMPLWRKLKRRKMRART